MSRRRPTGAVATPVPPSPVVVPRWVQLVLLPLACSGCGRWRGPPARSLLILIAASIVALILDPAGRLLRAPDPARAGDPARLPRRLRDPRRRSASCSSNPITTQVNHFEHNVPQHRRQANRDLANLQSWLNQHGINVQIQQQGQTALQTLQKDVLKSSGDIVSFSRDLLSQVVTIGFDLVLMLVLSIYLLVYGGRSASSCAGSCRPATGRPRTTSRCWSSARCSATCAGSCCSA